MNEHEWNATTDAATVAHRAGGRRRYNSARQRQAILRRMKVVKLIAELGFLDGAQSEIARRLGVHRSTICRDLEYFDLLERGYSPYEIYLRRKAERGQEIPKRPDTAPDILRYDHISVLIRELQSKGLSQHAIDTILNHAFSQLENTAD